MTPKRITEHERARQWRESLGLSRAALSRLIHYSQSQIQDYEAGATRSTGNPVDPDGFARYKLACAAVAAGLIFDWDAPKRLVVSVRATKHAKD